MGSALGCSRGGPATEAGAPVSAPRERLRPSSVSGGQTLGAHQDDRLARLRRPSLDFLSAKAWPPLYHENILISAGYRVGETVATEEGSRDSNGASVGSISALPLAQHREDVLQKEAEAEGEADAAGGGSAHVEVFSDGGLCLDGRGRLFVDQATSVDQVPRLTADVSREDATSALYVCLAAAKIWGLIIGLTEKRDRDRLFPFLRDPSFARGEIRWLARLSPWRRSVMDVVGIVSRMPWRPLILCVSGNPAEALNFSGGDPGEPSPPPTDASIAAWQAAIESSLARESLQDVDGMIAVLASRGKARPVIASRPGCNASVDHAEAECFAWIALVIMAQLPGPRSTILEDGRFVEALAARLIQEDDAVGESDRRLVKPATFARGCLRNMLMTSTATQVVQLYDALGAANGGAVARRGGLASLLLRLASRRDSNVPKRAWAITSLMLLSRVALVATRDGGGGDDGSAITSPGDAVASLLLSDATLRDGLYSFSRLNHWVGKAHASALLALALRWAGRPGGLPSERASQSVVVAELLALMAAPHLTDSPAATAAAALAMAAHALTLPVAIMAAKRLLTLLAGGGAARSPKTVGGSTLSRQHSQPLIPIPERSKDTSSTAAARGARLPLAALASCRRDAVRPGVLLALAKLVVTSPGDPQTLALEVLVSVAGGRPCPYAALEASGALVACVTAAAPTLPTAPTRPAALAVATLLRVATSGRLAARAVVGAGASDAARLFLHGVGIQRRSAPHERDGDDLHWSADAASALLELCTAAEPTGFPTRGR